MVQNYSDSSQKLIEEFATKISDGNWVYTSAKENINIELAVHMMIELVRFMDFILVCIPQFISAIFRVNLSVMFSHNINGLIQF